ncbi:unnamed protein product [Symbiodinium sp. KB8]|nr:unnamed protein product [Symbiodinium sp. KB8]
MERATKLPDEMIAEIWSFSRNDDRNLGPVPGPPTQHEIFIGYLPHGTCSHMLMFPDNSRSRAVRLGEIMYKITRPETKPIKSDRALGTVQISDLPIRHLEASPAKIEQFADILMGYQIDFTPGMFDQIYKLCYEDKYGQLPEPFSLVKAPLVPYTIQFVILPASVPQDADPNRSYYHIVKHVYLHRNKLSSKDCVAMCRGTPMRFEWGNSVRLGLAALNYMMDGMGGYEFIRNFGPRCNNRNQFMEWTDEQIRTPGGRLENWPESKVKEALSNYMKGRQNAKTLEFWPFTLKTFIPWFLNRVLTPMLPTMRQHAITWIGRTRTGKSLGSKTILFMQSKYEINEADRSDLVPSVVTAKHLDFSKEEDATVWARYSSAQFDQGAGRHACNNLYDKDIDKKLYNTMSATKVWHAGHDEFMKMIKPSFLAVDEDEDMDAILARTDLIVITDSGVYHRLASTSKDLVNFMPWDPNEPKDLVIASQHHIFKEYKMNPHIHKYPPSYYEDLAWSKLARHPELLSQPVLHAKVKQEKVDQAFRSLKSSSSTVIDISSPSPKTSTASAPSSEMLPPPSASALSSEMLPPPKRAKVPMNPDFPGLPPSDADDDDDVTPQVGHVPEELEDQLEQLMEEADGDDKMDIAD